LLVLNPGSNVAVVTLWTKKEVVAGKLREMGVADKVHAVGTLYTAYGVNYLLHTLAREPRIDTLIVFGADLSESGEALARLFRGEVHPGFRLMWPLKELEPLLGSVRLVDLRDAYRRGDWEALRRAILESYRPNASRPVVELELREVEARTWPVQAAGLYVVEDDLLRAWVKLVHVVMTWGYVKPSEYGERQRQLLGALVVLRAGEALRSAGRLTAYFPEPELERHARLLLEPAAGAAYTYGERLRAHREAGDQVQRMIDKLAQSPATRRAVAVTWDFSRDPASEDPPCLIALHGDLSEGGLSLTAFFRSHDALGAWPLNAYGLLRLMDAMRGELSARLGVEVGLGNLIVFSASLHVYEHDWARAEELLGRELRGSLGAFVRDDKGDFLVRVEGGRIILEHRAPDGSLAGVAEGRTAGEVLSRLNLSALMPSHAAYLARELARAEHALRYGQPYVQDAV